MMLPIFILLSLLTIAISGITTFPLVIVMLVCGTVIFQKSWMFFLAFFLGLIMDLFYLRSLGTTSLFLVIFISLIFLYQRKFEIQTLTFVFFSTLVGSVIYLMVFGYNNILLQAFVTAIVSILLFKFLWLKLVRRSETI